MARRCPDSVFLGRATLRAYRWQINERGVANVVQSARADHIVSGLVFLVGPRDKRALDRSEGVGLGFYEDQSLDVTFEPHERHFNVKTSRLSRLLPDQKGTDADGDTHMSSDGDGEKQKKQQQPPPAAQQVKALVYVSTRYTTDGAIRDEYISRMRSAVADAAVLGVPQSFLDDYIAPHLVEDKPTPPSPTAGASSTSAITGNVSSKVSGSRRGSEMVKSYDEDTVRQQVRQVVFSASSTPTNLHALKRENRPLPGGGSGVEFPPRMLDVVMAKVSEAGTGYPNVVYNVIVEERAGGTNTSGGGPSTVESTRDLEEATELAMRHFRQACSRLAPAEGERKRPDVGWELREDTYLYLHASGPEGGSRVAVWIDPQVVSRGS